LAAAVMTSDQQDAADVWTISDEGYMDALELLQLIEVIQGQNSGLVNQKLSIKGAAPAAHVVRNALLSRIVLFVAGAYAPPRPGDLHLRRAFDLMQKPEVSRQVGMMGSAAILQDAVILWEQCLSDPRLPVIKHFRNKFTAHRSKPQDIPLPEYEQLFAFAGDTMNVMDRLAEGTGARTQPLRDWQKEFASSAALFWGPWA
jgi:AbiU2